MKTKLVIVAAVATAVLSGSGLAHADDPPDQPDPNGPKCWEPTPDGWLHVEFVPCGWTYSNDRGWQRLPPPP